MEKKAIHRVLNLLVGIPFLPLGIAAIGMDIVNEIAAAQNQNPNLRVTTTFPLGTVVGIPHFWIGYQLVFSCGGPPTTGWTP